MRPRTITTARLLEIEANQLDIRASELTACTLTREELVLAWRQAAAIQRQQAAEIRSEVATRNSRNGRRDAA
jgi:hypothetical protein